MKIFHAYTRKTLRLNKTRTLVTIIGIILSVALITAVAEGAFSGIVYMRRVTETRVGSFAGFYEHMTDAEAVVVANDPEVSQAVSWGEVGYAEIGSKNPDKPYLCNVSLSDDFTDLAAVRLTQGRLPQNSAEIALPNHLAISGGVTYALGDTLTLQVGTRMLEGFPLDQHNPYTAEGETLEHAAERTYTVVGFYERFDNLVEDYSAPGFTALTTGETAAQQTVFFRLNHMGGAFDYLEEHPRNDTGRLNTDLLYYYGATSNSYIYSMMVGLVAILIGLIMFGSIALIYNAFSISVSERTKQFGLLKSIGATNKQLRGTVLYEALVLCAVAIPLGLLVGCLGIGVTLRALRGTFDTILGENGGVQMGIALNGWVLLFAAAIGLLTAVISAWVPAQRAARIPAIDAIRQTRDVAVRGRQVKTSKLTYKLFGFPGMLAAKNFKRNRKQYRATVVSLFLSVVLFISASSFCAYLTESVNTMTSAAGYELQYDRVGENRGDPEPLYQKLLAANSVTGGTFYDSTGSELLADADAFSDTFRNDISGKDGASGYNGNYHSYSGETVTPMAGQLTAYGTLYFVRDETFLDLLAKNGLDRETYYNADAPLALLFDRSTWMSYDEDGTRYQEYETFRTGALPIDVFYTVWNGQEGYYCVGTRTDAATGETLYAYAPAEKDPDTLTDEDYLLLPEDEAITKLPLRIGAKLETAPYFVEAGVALIYPYSFAQAVLGTDWSCYVTTYCLRSDDHRAAAQALMRTLNDAGENSTRLHDFAESQEQERAMITVVNVFSYGFIILISLIALANVFNTISTNIALRRREFAMLKSVGMTRGGFDRMMNYECLLYGFKGLLYGLPVSIGVTWLIYRAVNEGVSVAFHLPWYSVVIAVGSVFLVVFATMLYSMNKIKRENPIDALKNENF